MVVFSKVIVLDKVKKNQKHKQKLIQKIKAQPKG